MKDAQSEQNRITIRYEDLERGVSNGCEDCELVLSALMSFYPNRLQCPTQIDILTQSTNYMYEHYRRVRSEPFWRPGYLLAPETDYRKENHGKHQLWVALSIPKRYWSDTYHGWDEEGPSSTCIDIFRSHGRLFCFATRHTVEDECGARYGTMQFNPPQHLSILVLTSFQPHMSLPSLPHSPNHNGVIS
jgi:hypothetical protein